MSAPSLHCCDIDLDIITALLEETFAAKKQLIASNMEAIKLGYDYAIASISPVRCRCASRKWTRRKGIS